MPTPLTIAGLTYNYPSNRDPSGWGANAAAWAQAVTSALNNVVGPGDIVQSIAPINNGTSGVFVNVNGFFFDPTLVRGAVVEYNVYRATTGTGATEESETGTMYFDYLPNSGRWDLSIVGSHGSSVQFQITSAGQVQYLAPTITGSSYVGSIKFRARALTN